MYFQYDSSGNPFGFILNNVQYFYITNLNSGVVGITDANGNLIAEYTYDAWGIIMISIIYCMYGIVRHIK